MKYILIFLFVLCSPCWAQVPMTGAGKAATAVAGYSGPGDVIGSASGFWSCSRAYTAAYAAGAGNACDIADVGTGLITCTMKFATNGFADLTSNLCSGGTQTVPAFCTANTSCVVIKMYDHVGTSNCSGACNAVPSSTNPALTFGCSSIATIPCLTNSTNQGMVTPPWVTVVNQSCTYVGVTQRSSGTGQQPIISDGLTAVGAYFSGTGAGMLVYAGSSVSTTVSAANSAPHAFQGVFAGASSLVSVDGSASTPASLGTSACIASTDQVGIGSPVPSLLGIVWEVGLWPIGFNGAQITNMNSNQHTQYGF